MLYQRSKTSRAGEDPFETSHVSVEKSIGLVDVRYGSAVYSCVSQAPDEAKANLAHVGLLLSSTKEEPQMSEDGLVKHPAANRIA